MTPRPGFLRQYHGHPVVDRFTPQTRKASSAYRDSLERQPVSKLPLAGIAPYDSFPSIW